MAQGSRTFVNPAIESNIYGALGPRRLRQSKWIREMVQDVSLDQKNFMQPLFVAEGLKERSEVPGISGTFRDTPETLLKTIENDLEKGVRKFLLFGVPSTKGEKIFDGGFSASQIDSIKKRFGKDLFLAVDVCLCSYTTHGHCGVIEKGKAEVRNRDSVFTLSKLAGQYAQAGADCVAPSDMMDGRVAAIRNELDSKGCEQTLLMSYSAKFHSKFYGPFRVAADSAPNSEIGLSDRSTYQIDPACFRDAEISSLRDADEGADILMVKPALPYLDVLFRLSQEIQKPWAVYQVSGEYAAIEVLAREGLIKAPLAHVEAWTGMRRAGAQIIISYGSRYVNDYLDQTV